jgi:glyoxylase-like metal-dependent hydrolase (beta-lactamase superfamily II)
MPVLCFLLVHPKGPVLVDTGFGRRMVGFSASLPGKVVGALLRMTLEPGMDCRSRVKQCGVDPDALALGVLTHMHSDHTGALEDFAGTRFLASRDELAAVRANRGVRAPLAGYSPSLVAQIERHGEVEAFDATEAGGLEPFDRAYDVFGDGAVRLVPTAGHSPGHVAVLVRVSGGREVLLAGDAAFTQGHVFGQMGLGFMPRSFARDLGQTRRTLERLRTFVRERPGVRVLTSHDPDQGEQVAHGPVDVLA